MTRGKLICETLREVRRRIAEANEIRYAPHECTHEGECLGTCPACEAEVRQLERQLQARRRLGRAVIVAGISASLIPTGAMAQSAAESRQSVKSEQVDPVAQRIKQQINLDNQLFGVVEESAQFPGGDEACLKWLSEHIKYPSICREQGVQGRVIVSFVVNKDGSIVDVKTLRSPDENLAKEAERLVKIMPKWKPARQGNKTMRSRFQLPIQFRLGQQSSKQSSSEITP
ncbi:MAG: energy transducer TonB [Bacteroidaceae bacterium]|jgi:TonB family protein|nr:energy transducer TonB [Bacteroidaceae bacterium]